MLKGRDYYKPFEYPWAYTSWKELTQAHWLPSEVALHEDTVDWDNKLSEPEKNLLTQIFRFFTQQDVDVAKGYCEEFMPKFKAPELRMAMTTIAAMEAVHIDAYALLIDTLGMPETTYKAFQDYAEMSDKHDYMFAQEFTPDSVEDLAFKIAKLSTFGEGLLLFSSFAILKNFKRQGVMKGMNTIVDWSIRDETLHVEFMLKVFDALIAEHPYIWKDDFKKKIYQCCRDMVELEDKFIDLAFEQGGITGLEPSEIKQYIRFIADRRLLQLGLKTNYGVKENPLPWLDEMQGAQEHANFFESRSTEYSKGAVQGSVNEIIF